MGRHDRPLRWLLVSGPGGMGKSRLALEVVRAQAAGGWHAGFLDPTRGNPDWTVWQPRLPTLMVIDYAGRDAKPVGQLLKALAERERPHELRHPVRILILERETAGLWLNQITSASRLVGDPAIRAGGIPEGMFAVSAAACGRGIVWQHLHRFAEAIAAFEKSETAGNTSGMPEGLVKAARAAICRGIVLANQGLIPEAIEAFGTAEVVGRKSNLPEGLAHVSEAALSRGRALIRQENIEEAIAALYVSVVVGQKAGLPNSIEYAEIAAGDLQEIMKILKSDSECDD